jgi:hypothetical protein
LSHNGYDRNVFKDILKSSKQLITVQHSTEKIEKIEKIEEGRRNGNLFHTTPCSHLTDDHTFCAQKKVSMKHE